MPSKKTEREKEKERERKKEEEQQSIEDSHDVFTVLEWKAPGRPYKKRSRQYYLTSLLIMLLVEIILFLFSQYLLMVVVLALVFLAFSLAFIPPRDFSYRISSEGITVEDRFFLWNELYDFYVKRVDGVETIRIRTQAYFPGELVLTLGEEETETVKKALLPFLPFREYIKPTFMERSADWLSRNFPLDNQ